MDLNTTSPQKISKLLGTDEALRQQIEKLFGRTLAEKLYCLKHSIFELPKCQLCKSTIQSLPHSTRGYSKFCSRKCASRASADVCLQKRTATMVQRYGASSTLGSPDLRAKAEQTMLQRHGDTFGKSKSVRAKITNTNIKKYGGAAPSASAAVTQKSSANKKRSAASNHQAAIEKLGFTFKTPLQSIHDTVSVQHTCGYSHSFCLAVVQRYPICPNCQVVPGTSAAEREISEFVEALGFKTERRAKIGNPKFEIDIFIPDLKVGIEYHGLYWHSTELGTSPTKHQDRRKLAEAEGIKLIQIFEDEYILHPEIVQSVLRQKLGKTPNKIHARACKLHLVPIAEANAFFERTHLAGSARCSSAVGLYHNGALVACASIAPSRFLKGGFELIRFSVQLNTSIPGAVSRLVKNLPRPLISYCDLRYGTGAGYLAAGFTEQGDTKPGYWYFKKASTGRIHRSMLQKKKLLQLLNLDPSANLNTERELSRQLGYNTIYDAGHRRFSLGAT